MAFRLKPVTGKFNTFTATAGKTVTVTAEANQGSVVIQAISYNGTADNTAPFQFKTVAGPQKLVIIYAASDPSSLVSFFEEDSTGKRLLGVRLGTQNKAIFTIN
jgi:hypothetical protein